MIRSVITSFKSSNNLTLASIDERTGAVKVEIIDPSDENTLLRLSSELSEDYLHSDYTIQKRKNGLELVHSCSSVSTGISMPRTVSNIEEKPSFVGLLRKLILLGGKLLTTSEKEEIQHYEATSLMSLAVTNALGINLTHLVPSEENDAGEVESWRYVTDRILANNHLDQYNDITGLRFLCAEVDFGAYSSFLQKHNSITVVSESGVGYQYNCYSVKKELPLFSLKPNLLTTTNIVGILKYVSDSYKTAIRTLTADLFDDKNITYEKGAGSGTTASGRFLDLKSNAKTDKKAADAMSTFLFKSLSKPESLASEEQEIVKIYPHYPLYKAIIVSEIRNFVGESLSKEKKMAAYRRVKSGETLVNLLLLESRWQVMYHNNGALLELWAQNGFLKTNIDHYTIKAVGGGGTWQPSGYY